MQKEKAIQYFKNYYITAIILIINISAWICLELQGTTLDATFMYHHGAMYPGAIEKGEYYRLVSSMFMHFGVEHLINNMLMLVVLGYRLEAYVGHVGLGLIYMCSGIIGNIISYMHTMEEGANNVSAGASGAVFGIIGALLILVIMNKGRLYDLTAKGMALMVVLSLYYGFTATGVDNVAHVAGAITGAILGGIIGKIIDFIRKRQYTKS